MRLFPVLLSAAALIGLGAGSAKAEIYRPEGGSNQTMVERSNDGSVICRSSYDADDWYLYEFSERYDGTYDLDSLISVIGETYNGTDIYNIVTVTVPGLPTTGVIVDSDRNVIPGDGANMQLLELKLAEITRLVQSRQYHIGY